MSNSLSSVSEIQAAMPKISEWLPEHGKYLAHTRKGAASESFEAHVELVNQYFRTLCQCHGLDPVIDKIVLGIATHILPKSDSHIIAEIIKAYFVSIIYFHDLGKVNDNFQADPKKMNNPLFKLITNHPIGTTHSSLGAYLYILKHIQENWDNLRINHQEKLTLDSISILFSYPIFKHHASYLNDPVDGEIGFGEEAISMQNYLKLYQFHVDDRIASSLPLNIQNHLKRFDQIIKGCSFPLFSLTKLSFSLLTASDYLATHEYMSDAPTEEEDLGVLGRERIVEIADYLRSNGHNKVAYDALDSHRFEFPTEKSKDNLNLLRKGMAVEVIRTIKANLDKRLFYIEAPTGGGKTNLSMIAVTELLLVNPELNKVYYVFPFTTLITQTYAALKETLDLQSDELVELHSKAGFHSKISNEEQQDGEYGDEKKDFIDNLFALYPVTVLSHVKFFDVLKSNRKETNYLLHRLANSVVVIDEIQSYNPKIWDKMLYFISQYAEFFNIRFVVMSATLPKISALNIGLTQKPDFVELLPNARKYILNPNFAERVTFNFELLAEDDLTLERLAEAVIEKSEKYAGEHDKVRTIVEFIFKKSASEFQQLLKTMAHPFDEIFVLSGTVLEPRRREIINFIKRNANDQEDKTNILLITTQVVEAGVDIDMDLGFKNHSLLDSDEQLAGRVNRNASKKNCKVYSFNLDDARVLYKGDHRFQETKAISEELRERVLNQKDFKYLYDNVFTKIDKINDSNSADNFEHYQHDLKKLRFDLVDKNFKIIEQDNVSVFVPLPLPIEVKGTEEGKKDKIFSDKEIEFLENHRIFPKDEEKIEGIEVWECYKKLIFQSMENRKKKTGFDLKAKVHFKILQGIMSKFTFSLFAHSSVVTAMQEYCSPESESYGFKHLVNYNLVYCYEEGLIADKLDATENQFL